MSNDFDTIAQIGVNSFIDDDFYRDYKKAGKKGKQTLQEVFFKSIDICAKYGIANQIVIDGIPQGFILGFNYLELKRENPQAFSHFFSSKSKKMIHNLTEIQNAIESIIDENSEYIYILSVAVNKEHRGKGLATKLIADLCARYEGYKFITDISSKTMFHICEKQGFRQIGPDVAGCKIAVKDAKVLVDGFNKDAIYLAIPRESNFLDGYVKIGTTTLENLTQHDKLPTFCHQLNSRIEANIYELDSHSLLVFQSYIKMINCVEHGFSFKDRFCLYYVNNSLQTEISTDTSLKELVASHNSKEGKLIVDVITSIPMTNTGRKNITMGNKTDKSFYAGRTITALGFRTEYESGIPVHTLGHRGYKNRIQRINLGRIRIQLKSETYLVFNKAVETQCIGTPIDAFLILTLDTESDICVLHINILSFGEKITQYLDSVSRNQIEVLLSNDTTINLYEYLSNQFGLAKAGTAKTFVTSFEKRKDISDQVLSSILFCETYYEQGEGLSQIIDSQITELLSKSHGVAQYDYADVFMNTNIVFQCSPNLLYSVEDRIITESITLFYIELVLFEEAAICYADGKIKNYLSDLSKSSPNRILHDYGKQLREYASTIDFWNVQMNYPSSKVAIDNIRKYFKINELLDEYKRDQDIFRRIYETKSDYADRVESTILTTVGAVLTTISVIQLIWDAAGYYLLGIAGVIVGILIVLKYKVLFRDKDIRKKRNQ